MLATQHPTGSRLTAGALAAALLFALAACSHQTQQEPQAMMSQQSRTARAQKAATSQPAQGQETFATPDAAVAGLLSAVQADNHDALQKIFGPQGKELYSGDPVADKNAYQDFAQRTLEKAQLEERGDSTFILHTGDDDAAFPIPVVKSQDDGRWYFDTTAGTTEILARRIGANELETISLCRAYVQAQREYASIDHSHDEVLEYAQRLRSSPGKQDGLYFDATADQPQSPFGPLVAQASAEGYAPPSGSKANPTPFHGYYFHILKAQGPAAPGGAYNYVINGHMIAGFALIAYPDQYGKSGIMTFIVNHQGKVYQKDLGPKTADLAKKITAYNPDSSWTLVKE